MEKVPTPGKKTCEEVAEFLKLPLQRTIKSVALMHDDKLHLLFVRGDHSLNEIKAQKAIGAFRFATEKEILRVLQSPPGYLGPVGAKVVILNHPRWPSITDSPFAATALDPDTGEIHGQELTVDATELANSGCLLDDPLFLFRDWFALLNRGYRIGAVSASDSHTVGEPVGQGRSYVPSATDDPSKIDVDASCDALKHGRNSIAVGMPPIWTLTWALAMRRSSLARSTGLATPSVSQKAWIEMRGTGCSACMTAMSCCERSPVSAGVS